MCKPPDGQQDKGQNGVNQGQKDVCVNYYFQQDGSCVETVSSLRRRLAVLLMPRLCVAIGKW